LVASRVVTQLINSTLDELMVIPSVFRLFREIFQADGVCLHILRTIFFALYHLFSSAVTFTPLLSSEDLEFGSVIDELCEDDVHSIVDLRNKN